MTYTGPGAIVDTNLYRPASPLVKINTEINRGRICKITPNGLEQYSNATAEVMITEGFVQARETILANAEKVPCDVILPGSLIVVPCPAGLFPGIRCGVKGTATQKAVSLTAAELAAGKACLTYVEKYRVTEDEKANITVDNDEGVFILQ
ncbi:MAG: hypothetical protein HRU07_06680 [Nitrosopumilus sp.]|nr:hypothetical protein [Nitrosopumilus sp.]NRA05826.1 hypothetical protein [Nitrosopumilus sp.]